MARRGAAYTQFGNFAQPTVARGPTVYVTPPYLLSAAQKKYGQDISLIGAVESELDKFWDTVDIRSGNSQTHERPVEDCRIIVDITSKEHCNTGNKVDVIEVKTTQ